MRLLKESADRAIDHEKKPMKDFDFLENYMMKARFFKFVKCIQRIWCCGKFFQKYLFHYLTDCYDLCVNFVEDHDKAELLIKEVKKLAFFYFL